MKKSIFLLSILFLFLVIIIQDVYAILDADTNLTNITLNYPAINNTYNFSTGGVRLRLNITVAWTTPMNITNVTWFLIRGTNTTTFINATNGSTIINGTRTSTTTGDFVINITFGDIAEGNYNVIVEVRNDSDARSVETAINSSRVSFVIDRTPPVINLERPQDRISLSPTEGKIVWEYTPTETNLGNCTLFLGGNRQQSSTSGTIFPNVTTGVINKFGTRFSSDNTSLIWLVECTDLAGQRANSSSRTINVMTTGFTNVVDASGRATTGGKEYFVKEGKTLSVGSPTTKLPPKKESTFISTFGWLIALVLVAVVIYLSFIWKPKSK